MKRKGKGKKVNGKSADKSILIKSTFNKRGLRLTFAFYLFTFALSPFAFFA
jgi:hypothetical protein